MTSLTKHNLPTVRATIFDVDGLLINSEDLYTACTNVVLRQYGKPDLPWSIKAKLQGRPGPEAFAMLQEWAQIPVSDREWQAQVEAEQKRQFPTTQVLPGVEDLLERLVKARQAGSLQMAVATSSHTRNFLLKTSHLPQITSKFDAQHTIRGDDPRIPAGRGKPAPDIFLLALQVINESLAAEGKPEIHPEECLVFEDSVPGVEAARRAGMQVAWVPHVELKEIFKGREPEVLAGQTGEHVDDGKESEGWIQKREEWIKQGRAFARVRGAAGDLDDGWAREYKTLENFPLEYYGIVEA